MASSTRRGERSNKKRIRETKRGAIEVGEMMMMMMQLGFVEEKLGFCDGRWRGRMLFLCSLCVLGIYLEQGNDEFMNKPQPLSLFSSLRGELLGFFFYIYFVILRFLFFFFLKEIVLRNCWNVSSRFNEFIGLQKFNTTRSCLYLGLTS